MLQLPCEHVGPQDSGITKACIAGLSMSFLSVGHTWLQRFLKLFFAWQALQVSFSPADGVCEIQGAVQGLGCVWERNADGLGRESNKGQITGTAASVETPAQATAPKDGTPVLTSFRVGVLAR